MRKLFLALATILAPLTAAAQDRPVVVELFTSQGCSSCPPADAILHELVKDPQIIPLALHVDYWDYIGWKDSFASPAFTKRQRTYASAQEERMVYTPQMMVNGMSHVVGSRRSEISALVQAAKGQQALVGVSANLSGDSLTINVDETQVKGPFIVHVVSYRPNSTVQIKRGENAGRTITYANVVTNWRSLVEWSGRSDDTFKTMHDDSKAVVLIQRKGFGEIIGATRVN
ncbi:MAG: DUF1223 domain-containing protein [Planktomarina sp.]